MRLQLFDSITAPLGDRTGQLFGRQRLQDCDEVIVFHSVGEYGLFAGHRLSLHAMWIQVAHLNRIDHCRIDLPCHGIYTRRVIWVVGRTRTKENNIMFNVIACRNAARGLRCGRMRRRTIGGGMRMARFAIAAAVLGGVGLSAVPAGATTASQTKLFVKDVRFLDPDASGVSTKTILSLGNGVCKDLKSGTSVKTLAKVLKGTDKVVLEEAAVVLCPKYQKKVLSYYASVPTTVPVPHLTQQQKTAVASAKQYLSFDAFSQAGLIAQLDSPDGGQFSVNDATVAVDSLTVDWNAEAVKSAKSYMKLEPMSCQALIDQLDSSAGAQFTVAQATYGAQQAGDC